MGLIVEIVGGGFKLKSLDYVFHGLPIAGLEGAVGQVVSPANWVLPVLALGALWVVLWQGRARWLGVAPAAIALALWGQVQRPQVLVADNGGLVGVLTEQGRALSKPKGSGFVAGIWLENDGDGAAQAQAAGRWPKDASPLRQFTVDDVQVVHAVGKRAAKSLTRCDADQVVIASVSIPLEGPCAVFDPVRLRKTGSLAYVNGTWQAANDISGTRIWAPKSRRAR